MIVARIAGHLSENYQPRHHLYMLLEGTFKCNESTFKNKVEPHERMTCVKKAMVWNNMAEETRDSEGKVCFKKN